MSKEQSDFEIPVCGLAHELGWQWDDRHLAYNDYHWFTPLFIVADISQEKINNVLRIYEEERYVRLVDDEKGITKLRLATGDWNTTTLGKTPIPSSFKSPYIGYDPTALWHELRYLPSETEVRREFFLIMDERTERDDTLLICHPVDSREQDRRDHSDEVEMRRCTPDCAYWILRGLPVLVPQWRDVVLYPSDHVHDRLPYEGGP